jgi:hypothetical protein
LVFACALFAFAVPAGLRAQGQAPAAATQDALARFPVAHEHNGSWCLGYLYIYADSIAYDATWPAASKSHSFTLTQAQILQVSRWTRSGQSLKALEIKSSKATYHFWWLANEQDVVTGKPYQKDPPDAGDPDFLIAAIRNPTTLTGGGNNSTAQAAPAAATDTAANLQQVPVSPLAANSQSAPPASAPTNTAAQLQQLPGSPLAGGMQTAPSTLAPQQGYNPIMGQPGVGGAGVPGTATAEQRFAVVHIHTASQCAGYLYISQGHIRYEALQPAANQKHSFDLQRNEVLSVTQWVLMGTIENAVEIKTAHGNYHFWLLPDGSDVANTASSRWTLPSLAQIAPLIAALRGQAQ